ncbi:MAG: response regulator [Ruminiclostridium sp.]|nr:response regulator [Ruminiclostridium sp.]
MDINERIKEIHKHTHLLFVTSYTFLCVLMVFETIVLEKELWPIAVIAVCLILSWSIHVMRYGEAVARLRIYALFWCIGLFYIGIISVTTYEITPLIVIYLSMAALAMEKSMIWSGALVGITSMAIHLLVRKEGKGLVLEAPNIARVVLQFIIVVAASRIAFGICEILQKTASAYNDELKRIEDKNRRTDELMTNISHEIRTPINAVIGLSTVLSNNTENKELRETAGLIRSAGFRAADQLGNISDYTELGMRTLVITKERYMISSIISDLIAELQYENNTDVELIFDVEPLVPAGLIGDSEKIRRILRQLVNNGIKFASEGCVYVHVFCIKRGYGINLCFEVTDTGEGMTPEETEHLTEAFYQSDAGVKRSAGGLGLGIRIVDGFVSAMGGFMIIESEKGVGTTVRVSIPQEIADGAPCASAPNKDVCLAGYLSFEYYKIPQIREYYQRTITDLVKQLELPFHNVTDIEDLKKLRSGLSLTHLFIGTHEYLENEEYIESIASDMIVIVSADYGFTPKKNSRVKLLRKPFYCIPIVNYLNMTPESIDEEYADMRMYCPGVKVLVVDDDSMNLLVAEGIFREYGMTVYTAKSGRESIEMCAKNRYDIVFMDHMMPEMDGVEAMKRIRMTSAKNGDLFIAALTANMVSSAKDMLISEGFDAFLAKPIIRPALESVLRKALPKSAIHYIPEEDIYIEPPAGDNHKYPAEEPAVSASASLIRFAEELGINTADGMSFCADDEEFYSQLLGEYAASAPQKAAEIERLLTAGDLKNYNIKVHALKSNSRTVGAAKLSEMFLRLENASKNGDTKTIEELHGTAMKLFAELTERLRAFIGEERREG